MRTLSVALCRDCGQPVHLCGAERCFHADNKGLALVFQTDTGLVGDQLPSMASNGFVITKGKQATYVTRQSDAADLVMMEGAGLPAGLRATTTEAWSEPAATG